MTRVKQAFEFEVRETDIGGWHTDPNILIGHREFCLLVPNKNVYEILGRVE